MINEKETETIRSRQPMQRRMNQADQIDLLALIDDVFDGIRHHMVIILVAMSIMASLFYFYEKVTYTPKYMASTTFVVNTNSAINYGEDNFNYNYSYNYNTGYQISLTFPNIISSDALKTIVEQELGVEKLNATITAEALEEMNLITLNVIADSPEYAYEVLQTVMKSYPKVTKGVIGSTDLSVMSESGIPKGPVNPFNPARKALLGCLFGMALCLGAFGLKSILKKTIRHEEDFQRLLNVKCLGGIPKVKLKKSRYAKEQLLISNNRIPYGFIESIRTCRTRVERDHAEEGSKVYLVSSALEGEGKSTVASNLAISLAAKGQRVFLVDFDMRNSSVCDVLGLKKAEKGLADVLRGTASVSSIMIEDEESGVLVLPGGHAGGDARLLLNDDKLKPIFRILRSKADYIIVDTPPSSLLSDAASLVEYVDAGIFVVRQDYSPVSRVLDGVELLSETGLRICGCVLNQVQAGVTGGYGYGYGRYGRYSRYGRYGKYGKYGEK